MNGIRNILNVIGETLAGTNSANPFDIEAVSAGVNHIDNFEELKRLKNDDDDFVNEKTRDDFQKFLAEFLAGENSEIQNLNVKSIAKKLNERINEFLKSKGVHKGTKDWFKNYNAAISHVKNSGLTGAGPELSNALRAEAVKELSTLEPDALRTPRDLSKIANTAWGEAAEIVYEHAGDKVRENKEKLSKGLESLKEEIGDEGTDKNHKTIKSIVDNFGTVENFNKLLKENGINYQIIEKDGKYTVAESNSYNSSEVEDKEGANEGYRTNLDSWNQNSGELNNINLDDFDKQAAKKLLQEYGDIYRLENHDYGEISLEKGQELLETLNKANMYHLKNSDSPFTSEKLNRARRHIIKQIHDAESKARTEDPEYRRSESLNNAIMKINTLHHLKTKEGQQRIIDGLNQAAKATGHKDYKAATGGDDSEISKLIETINNRPTLSEYDSVTNTVSKAEIEKIESKKNNDNITIKLKDGTERKVDKQDFIEALDKDFLILYGDDDETNTDDKKIVKLRSLFNNWRWDASDNSLATSVDEGIASGLEFILSLPKEEQDRILERLNYKDIEELKEAISRSSNEV